MKLSKSIVIDEAEFSGLYEEILSLSDTEIADIDSLSEEGLAFRKRFPCLFKLHNILQTEMMKDQNTYAYERIKKEE